MCSGWGKVNVLRLLNTHQCLWNGRWLLIGNKLEYSVFYGTNREIKLHFPCFCISNRFGEPAGWTEEQLHDKSVCVMFYSDDTLRRRQGFKREDEGNKDISGCFKTECFCPEWRAHHIRIDFSAWWLKYLSDLDISSKQVRKKHHCSNDKQMSYIQDWLTAFTGSRSDGQMNGGNLQRKPFSIRHRCSFLKSYKEGLCWHTKAK